MQREIGKVLVLQTLYRQLYYARTTVLYAAVEMSNEILQVTILLVKPKRATLLVKPNPLRNIATGEKHQR